MTAQVTVRYWAGAKRAAGRGTEQLTAGTVEDLLAQLRQRVGLDRVLAVSSVLIDGRIGSGDTALPAGCIVDILPPFAGG